MRRPLFRARGASLRAVTLLVLSVLVLFVGQVSRELLRPDDLREAEIAREMYVSGDYVIPHLAGRPFVEKPPAFQAVVALAYRIAGGPSRIAARLVSILCALLSLVAVFLLGRRIMGVEGAALGVALLALSSRFCRTAHLVLLDNALTMTLAFALLWAWIALVRPSGRTKRLAYAALGATLGVSFLVKGIVGPALFAAGFLTYVALERRWGELRDALGPLPLFSFLAPVLVWVVPFTVRAEPHLLYEHFVANTFGRFAYASYSHAGPVYYYLLDIWAGFAPSAWLLPFAIAAAWANRRTTCAQGAPTSPAWFLAYMALGAIVLLSLSKAKESVYLLPAYPALALLTAVWADRALSGGDPRRITRGLGVVTVIACGLTLAAIVATTVLGGHRGSVALAVLALFALGAWTGHAVRHGLARDAVVGVAAILAIGWALWFTGPIAAAEVRSRNVRPVVETMIEAAAGREILLYTPDDGLRGAFGFYRNRTALEYRDARALVRRLRDESRETVAIARSQTSSPQALVRAAAAEGVELRLEAQAADPGGERLIVLLSAPNTGRGEAAKSRLRGQKQSSHSMCSEVVSGDSERC